MRSDGGFAVAFGLSAAPSAPRDRCHLGVKIEGYNLRQDGFRPTVIVSGEDPEPAASVSAVAMSGQRRPLGGHFDQPAGSEGAPSISSAIPLPIRLFRLFDGELEMVDMFPKTLINVIYWG
jgi:hypothetical protein